MDETLGRLDIRVGRITALRASVDAPKPSYVLTVDFGRFGVKTSVARLTHHAPDELIGRLVFGVLNIGDRQVGTVRSEFLCLGVQIPGAASGEATIVTPLLDEIKLGSKLF